MREDKTIVRVCKSKDNPYVMINKALLQNPELSAKEKGILAYLLSLPDDWTIHMSEIIHHFADGRDSIYSGFASLINKGFIERTIIRQITGQVIRYEYRVFEAPQDARQSTVSGKSRNGSPVTTNIDCTNNETQPISCLDTLPYYVDPVTRAMWDTAGANGEEREG